MGTPEVRFVVKGFHSLKVRIPEGENTAERKSFDAMRRKAGGKYLAFTPVDGAKMADPSCEFTTGDSATQKFIRAYIDRRAVPLSVVEDYSTLPVRCPYTDADGVPCGFITSGNTAADQQALGRHVAEAHAGQEL